MGTISFTQVGRLACLSEQHSRAGAVDSMERCVIQVLWLSPLRLQDDPKKPTRIDVDLLGLNGTSTSWFINAFPGERQFPIDACLTVSSAPLQQQASTGPCYVWRADGLLLPQRLYSVQTEASGMQIGVYPRGSQCW